MLGEPRGVPETGGYGNVPLRGQMAGGDADAASYRADDATASFQPPEKGETAPLGKLVKNILHFF